MQHQDQYLTDPMVATRSTEIKQLLLQFPWTLDQRATDPLDTRSEMEQRTQLPSPSIASPNRNLGGHESSAEPPCLPIKVAGGSANNMAVKCGRSHK